MGSLILSRSRSLAATEFTVFGFEKFSGLSSGLPRCKNLWRFSLFSFFAFLHLIVLTFFDSLSYVTGEF